MRILACFFVICIHISIGRYFEERISSSAVFLSCIRADAVAMFWFIAGAFYFESRYTVVIRRTFKRIVIPVLILIFFVGWIDGWLFEGMTLYDSIRLLTIRRAAGFIKTMILYLGTPVGHTGQLWYIFTYLIVVLLFPVEKAFVDYLDSENKFRYFAIISFGLLLLNDISDNRFACFSHQPFGALIPAVIIMIWGQILFLVINVCRCLILLCIYRMVDNTNECILFWYSSFGVLTSISLYMFVFWISKKVKFKWLKKTIVFVGAATFDIYLIHEIVIDLFNKYMILDYVRSLFGINGSMLKQLIYYLFVGVLIFLSCLILSMLVQSIKLFVETLLHKSNICEGITSNLCKKDR